MTDRPPIPNFEMPTIGDLLGVGNMKVRRSLLRLALYCEELDMYMEYLESRIKDLEERDG